MDEFHTGIRACEFSRFEEFVREFSLGADDVLVTHRFLFERYMQNMNLSSRIIFYEDYGDGEPTEDMFDAICAVLAALDFRRIVGIGGGSVLDLTKLLAVKDAKAALDIYEDRIPLVREKGLILVPTTCGTGSETDGISVLHLNKRGCKVGKGIPCNIPDASVLISELLVGLPFDVFMYCSLDAMVHGIETYLSPHSHSFSRVFGAEGVRLLVRNYVRLDANGPQDRLNHLAEYARASAFGGVAMSHNPCGAIHACAMYFGGIHGVSHGRSVSLFTSEVLKRYARINPDGAIADLAKIVREEMGLETDVPGALAALDALVSKLIPREQLRDFGMAAGSGRQYAEKVLETQQRLIVQNYVPLPVDELTAVFESLY